MQNYSLKSLNNLKLTKLELSIYQTVKLRELIKFSQIYSPWYRDKLGSLDPEEVTLDNMHQLIPSLSKRDYIDNWDDICTNRLLKKKDVIEFLEVEREKKFSTYLFKNEYHIISSSGSGGIAGIFLYNKEEWLQYCSQYSRYNFIYSLKDSNIANLTVKSQLFASPRVSKTIFSSSSDREIINYQEFDFMGDPENTINKLNQMQPSVLITLPSILQKLCCLKESSELRINPKIIKVSAEPLTPGLRQRAMSIFSQSKLYNIYGGSEGFSAVNCANNPSKMHLAEDFCIFELNNKSHINVTNLYLKTTPLLRFQIDDKLERMNSIKCEDCGTYFSTIKEPQGRHSQDFIYSNGITITPLEITEIMNHYPQITEFQAVQTKQGICLYITNSSSSLIQTIRSLLKDLA